MDDLKGKEILDSAPFTRAALVDGLPRVACFRQMRNDVCIPTAAIALIVGKV